MKKAKVAVIGHFGLGLACLDGQTIKTKIVTEELERQFGQSQVVKYDTHGGKWKSICKAPLYAFKALRRSRNVIIFPAQNGLKIFVPLLLSLKAFFKNRKLHYVVIGGWLPQFLKDKPRLTRKLQKFDGIYVETDTMKTALEKQGFTNVTVVPNCKELQILAADELVYPGGEPYKLCTFSRVMKEKGIEDAVNAIKAINEKSGRTVYTLDIYGQVDPAQIAWFDGLQKSFPAYIRYGGLVDYDKSVDTLKNYFALLFPTYYQGEGFAGTVLDAFAAGIPVIASDWKYNSEIVTEDVGALFKTKSQVELIRMLEELSQNASPFLSKKQNCIEKAKQFLPETALKPFTQRLDAV